MRDTVKSLMESAVAPHMDASTKNRIAFSGLRSISEAAVEVMKFNPQKVIVNRVGENYMIEYAANIERLMEDQNMNLCEAVECVANMNNIALENCILVLDESSISSGLNINSIIEAVPKFTIARM